MEELRLSREAPEAEERRPSGIGGDVLASVLRGAAKILGCNTATLIVLSERTGTVRIRVGVGAEVRPALDVVEEAFGGNVNELTFTFPRVRDSLIFRSWSEDVPLECSTIEELARNAFPEEAFALLASVLGPHRFICVPVATRVRRYGVIIFEKDGDAPFSRQQRELMVRYAGRIAEILENDLWSVGDVLLRDAAEPPVERAAYAVLRRDGTLLSSGGAWSVEADGGELWREVRQRAWTAGAESRAEPMEIGLASPAGVGRRKLWMETARLPWNGEDAVLCRLWEPKRAAETSLENVLLQLATGEAAPALFVDAEYRITSANPATETLFGYAAGELRNRPVEALFQDPQDVARLLNHRLLLVSQGYGEEGTVIRRRDGTLLPARMEAVLLADPEHRVLGFLLLIRPRPHPDTGAAGLVQRERLATMGEMAAALAHEIRNPLVAIGAALEGLGAELAHHEDAVHVLADVSREIVRLDMLLRDYLSLAVRQNAALARVDLADPVEDACRLLRQSGKLGDRRLENGVERGMTVMADSDALRHVFFNLLLNAAEATPESGRIFCRARGSEREAAVTVEDDGAGLAAPGERCLEPFFTTKENGSGLGLAVCQRIVQSHGGALYLQQREEGGCRATVVLRRGG